MPFQFSIATYPCLIVLTDYFLTTQKIAIDIAALNVVFQAWIIMIQPLN
ncbi:hypothetical protein MgSA37_03582 [Mucilaginibacter gotjawali]|uniref:Uncharacterized protein n=2 Tax=Mucilaginibacter gotjawali TaxID=1550579 RepID=A0A0X8X5E5_9SPHI|nr:hypothetical protein [Mucilaginibacter gotjawali]BAU55398.1 hypothetical protein MgSA37_03582 [Mucilaginibacter gotjawali]